MTTFAARPVARRSRRVERARVTIYDRDLYRRIIVDNFAGFGGAGLGIANAAGRPVDVAINHCPLAIEYHTKNSPGTLHLCSSVWEIDPDDACGGRAVALAWFSPDCRHFSRAKGKPKVDKRVRSLAWVVIKWAKEKQPDVIILENVREFETWGPLIEVDGPNGKHTVPDPDRKGETFRRWWRSLERSGYVVEKRVLNAADFGAPTIRKRLFIIARRDGKPIRWPEATHGRGEVQGGCVGDSVRTRSGADGRGLSASHAGNRDDVSDDAGGGGRSRRRRGNSESTPSGVATEARVAGSSVDGGAAANRTAGAGARGTGHLPAALKPYRTAAECIDWSLPVKSIFERARPLAEKTQRRIAMGIWRYLINSDRPYLVRVNHGGEHFRGQSIEQPLGTVTRQHGYGLVVPTLVSGYGEAPGQEPRARGVDQPAPTVPASGKHALAAAMLGWSIEDALLNHGRVHALSQMGSWCEGDGLGPPYPDEPRPIGTLVNVNGLDHTERPKDAASGDHWHVHRLGALVAAYRDVCMRLGAVT